MPKISMDKVYQTSCGAPARIVCIDRKDKYPVVALIGPSQTPCVYTDEGKFGSTKDGHMDLIEVVPEKWHYVVGHSEGHFTVSMESYPDAAAAERAFTCRLGYGYLAGVWKE